MLRYRPASHRFTRAALPAVFLALVLIAPHLLSQSTKTPRPVHIDKIDADAYLIAGEGGNVFVRVTDEGVVMVDDMFDRNHDDIMAAVRSLTNKPLKYVINTHQHDDHAGGDFRMLPLTEVVAHRNARINLEHIKQPYYEDTPGTPIGLPRLTFSDQFAVHIGGKEIVAQYFGPGHTNGDIVVYFPDLKLLHTGDLFLGSRPRTTTPAAWSVYIDYAQGGSLREWPQTLDGVLSLDFDRVIPGHGPLSKKNDIVTFRADLVAMRDRLTGLVKKGTTSATLLHMLETEYGWKVAGCPPTPPTAGCLQYQQSDALLGELGR